MKHFAIIVAGGNGTRIGGLPKQFQLLGGKPVLMHSIEKFSRHTEKVVVVLPEKWIEEWKAMCKKFEFFVQHECVKGGEMRAESVKNGLATLSDDGIVAVHDAARPLVSESLISKLFNEAEEKGNAVPVVKPGDSIRELTSDGSKAVNRDNYRMVQTPQVFPVSVLNKAFNMPGFREFTDEASLVEAMDQHIYLIEGESINIKITLPGDLQFAETRIL